MVLTKRVAAPIAFAWTLAAAGMAAVALSASPDNSGVEDVQVGERNNQTRIALICAEACNVTKRDNSVFLLHGANADFDVDLSARSKFVTDLVAVSAGGGSLLRVTPNYPIEYANTKNCTVGGRAAACIDLFFDLTGEAALVSEPKAEKKAKPVAAAPAPALKDTAMAEVVTPKPASPKPALREGAPERMTVFARLTPPERLTPPSGAILAKVQPIERSVEIRKPAILMEEPLTPSSFDFSTRVKTILGKDLTPAYCNNAEATLQSDAWALGAMVDVGLCIASRGDVVEADAMLARLLDYTPDNYEALVGRALIAQQAEEKSVARKYFQDALNALPPIEESNRIVQAMATL